MEFLKALAWLLGILLVGVVAGFAVSIAFPLALIGYPIFAVAQHVLRARRETATRRPDEQEEFARSVFRAQGENSASHERDELAQFQCEETPEGQAGLEAQGGRAAEQECRMDLEVEVQLAQAEPPRKEPEGDAARRAWNAFFESKSIEQIASMSGIEFELFLVRLLHFLRYADIELTDVNDQGGDILCTSQEDVRVVVQAKRWKKPLGNGVIQEILGAMLHYGCNRSMVITNSSFTRAAKALASKDKRISLCDGHWLSEQIKKHLPREIPPFDPDRHRNEVGPAMSRISKLEATRTPRQTLSASRRAEVFEQVAAGSLSVEDASRILAGR